MPFLCFGCLKDSLSVSADCEGVKSGEWGQLRVRCLCDSRVELSSQHLIGTELCYWLSDAITNTLMLGS